MAPRAKRGIEHQLSESPLVRRLRGLGFPEPVEVGTLRTVAHLFGSREPRTGIYALLLPEERLYVGQAADVVRRFAQHRLAHEAIDAFAFVPVAKAELDARERQIIQSAEAGGLYLTNVVHVSNVRGETDLDALVAPEDQERWRHDPAGVNARDDACLALLELPTRQRNRYQERFERLLQLPMGPSAINLLRTFLAASVPFPRTTEYTFWTVSCLPSNGQTPGGRLLCVTAGVVELFTVLHELDPDGRPIVRGFVNVAGDVLLLERRRLARAGRVLPLDLDAFNAPYRFPGGSVIQCRFRTEAEGIHVLQSPAVMRAAGALSLAVMRKRASIYTKFHSQGLAHAALQTSSASSGGSLVEDDPGVDAREFCDRVIRDAVPEQYRRETLEAISVACELASAVDENGWGLRITNGGVTLFVRSVAVLEFSPGFDTLFMILDRAMLSGPITEESTIPLGLIPEDYVPHFGDDAGVDSVEGLVTTEVPFGHLGRVWPKLRPALSAVIARAAKGPPNSSLRVWHEPAFVEYIADEVGRPLRQPTYVISEG